MWMLMLLVKLMISVEGMKGEDRRMIVSVHQRTRSLVSHFQV